jgi:cytochrome P450
MQPLFFKLTLTTARDFLFGPADDEDNELAEKTFNTSYDVAVQGIVSIYRLGPFSRFYRDSAFESAVTSINIFVDHCIAKELKRTKQADHDENDANEPTFLLRDLLKGMPDLIRVRSEALNCLLAGRDTTAGLLGNLFHVLARRPDVWAKLQDEVRDVDTDTLDFEKTKQLKYVRYCLLESMLIMHPPPSSTTHS